MSWKVLVLLCFMGLLCPSMQAKAEDSTSPTASMRGMTKEQFAALGLDAIIDVEGERLTKREFLARRAHAGLQVAKKIQEWRAQTGARTERMRKTFFDAQQAELNTANKKTEDTVRALQAATKRPSNFDATVQDATALLERAQTAQPAEAAQLDARAGELLKMLTPEATAPFLGNKH